MNCDSIANYKDPDMTNVNKFQTRKLTAWLMCKTINKKITKKWYTQQQTATSVLNYHDLHGIGTYRMWPD